MTFLVRRSVVLSFAADDRCYKTRCAFGCIQYSDGFRCYCPGGLQLTSDGLGCQGWLPDANQLSLNYESRYGKTTDLYIFF